jgi:hypothetical protein
MRFRQRSNVLLPEPEGPMSATVEPRGTGNETSATAGTPR